MFKQIVIIGANGAIGHALIEAIGERMPAAAIHAVSRHTINRQSMPHQHANVVYHTCNLEDETALANLAQGIASQAPIDWVLVATGLLHNDAVKPEKALKSLDYAQMQAVFMSNTFLPAMLTKHFAPYLHKQSPSVMAILSARVGSISDNRLGGWYSYRASKAALNMLIKTTSIELKRTNKQAILVGFHPGTVDTPLSAPYQKHVPVAQLKQPSEAADHLLDVIANIKPDDSGNIIDWKGERIEP